MESLIAESIGLFARTYTDVVIGDLPARDSSFPKGGWTTFIACKGDKTASAINFKGLTTHDGKTISMHARRKIKENMIVLIGHWRREESKVLSL